MQVTLNIDANLAGSVQDVFSALSADDKRSLALTIMREFLDKPHNAEQQAFEHTTIARMRETDAEVYINGSYTRRGCKDLPDEQIRGTNEFSSRIQGFKSTRQTMIEMITTATIASYREAVTQLVREDPQTQAMKDAVLAQIREDFPKYVHDAMAAWFVQGLNGMQQGMMNALMQAQSAEAFSKNVADRLRLQ